MKNHVPSRPDLLIGFLAKLFAGDDAHQQEGVLSKDLRAGLEAMKTQLDSLSKSTQLSKGRYRQDAQGLRELVTKVLEPAERAVDSVFAKYGHKNDVLVDFGLASRRKRSRVESTEAKANRAQSLLAKARVQLERVNLRKSRVEALVARREAEAALAVPVTPPEQGPTSEPAPSNGK